MKEGEKDLKKAGGGQKKLGKSWVFVKKAGFGKVWKEVCLA
jgi:hypothetical protein